jgi:hypothetical protein
MKGGPCTKVMLGTESRIPSLNQERRENSA